MNINAGISRYIQELRFRTLLYIQLQKAIYSCKSKYTNNNSDTQVTIIDDSNVESNNNNNNNNGLQQQWAEPSVLLSLSPKSQRLKYRYYTIQQKIRSYLSRRPITLNTSSSTLQQQQQQQQALPKKNRRPTANNNNNRKQTGPQAPQVCSEDFEGMGVDGPRSIETNVPICKNQDGTIAYRSGNKMMKPYCDDLNDAQEYILRSDRWNSYQVDDDERHRMEQKRHAVYKEEALERLRKWQLEQEEIQRQKQKQREEELEKRREQQQQGQEQVKKTTNVKSKTTSNRVGGAMLATITTTKRAAAPVIYERIEEHWAHEKCGSVADEMMLPVCEYDCNHPLVCLQTGRYMYIHYVYTILPYHPM